MAPSLAPRHCKGRFEGDSGLLDYLGVRPLTIRPQYLEMKLVACDWDRENIHQDICMVQARGLRGVCTYLHRYPRACVVAALATPTLCLRLSFYSKALSAT